LLWCPLGLGNHKYKPNDANEEEDTAYNRKGNSGSLSFLEGFLHKVKGFEEFNLVDADIILQVIQGDKLLAQVVQ